MGPRVRIASTLILLYYAVLSLALLLAAPFLLWSPKRRAGLMEKLGRVPPRVPSELAGRAAPVWFHAVSVGEFNAAWPLIEEFHRRHPDIPVCISTATATGQQLARDKAGSFALVFYFPLDLPWASAAWLDAVAPQLMVIVETEIWPGFSAQCRRRSLPLVVINGRISPRSFRSYRRLRFLFGPTLRGFSAIVAQSDGDASRFRAVGGDSLPVRSVGNLKFDGLSSLPADEVAELRQFAGVPADAPVFVAGSTHPGEETACLRAYERLLAAHEASAGGTPVPRLVLAPRHPERFQAVAELVRSLGFRPRRYSAREHLERHKDVFLLDTIGQLGRFYALGRVAFVGGTLAPIGGHNLLEPYAHGVPVICGPSLDKTADVARGLEDIDALVVVGSEAELADRLVELFFSPLAAELGLRGQRWIAASQGAVERTLAVVETFLKQNYNTERATTGGPQATGS